eukprot:scaffold150988_cov19-Tisochrysis_lutea.AAC.1
MIEGTRAALALSRRASPVGEKPVKDNIYGNGTPLTSHSAQNFQTFADFGRLALSALSNTCHPSTVTPGRLAQHSVKYYYLYHAVMQLDCGPELIILQYLVPTFSQNSPVS